MLPLAKFIELLEENFKAAEQKYNRLYEANQDKNEPKCDQLISSLRKDDPLKKIIEALIDYDEQSGFPKLVKSELFANNVGIFEYLKILFKRQHNIINHRWGNEVKYYTEFSDEVVDYINLIHDEDSELSVDEFLKAYIFYFIDCLSAVELEFSETYATYEPVLPFKFNVSINNLRFEPIKLKYGENNETVTKLLYENLNVEFIEDVSFDEFCKHFGMGKVPIQKMRWKKNDLLLSVLFVGKRIEINHKLKLISVEIKNDYVDVICKHFEKKDGKNFIAENVRENLRNLDKKVNRGETKIIELLQTLHQFQSETIGSNTRDQLR